MVTEDDLKAEIKRLRKGWHEQAKAITCLLEDLVNAGPPWDAEIGYYKCCHEEYIHTSDCPWRKAKEYAADHHYER